MIVERGASRRLAQIVWRAAMGVAFLSSVATSNAADFEVRSPLIDIHEFEYDAKFSRGYDSSSSKARGRGLVHEIEFGVLDWWSPALEGEWDSHSGPNNRSRFQGLTFENRFQLTNHEDSWADFGLFVEYERSAGSSGPNAVRIGPLIRKDFGQVTTIFDVVAIKEWGRESRRQTQYSYAWQTRWTAREDFQPGFEIYGGSIEAGTASPRQRMGGPVFFGVFNLGEKQDIRYELGYLFGFNNATPSRTVKILMGYEYRF